MDGIGFPLVPPIRICGEANGTAPLWIITFNIIVLRTCQAILRIAPLVDRPSSDRATFRETIGGKTKKSFGSHETARIMFATPSLVSGTTPPVYCMYACMYGHHI